jgi:hypothetical protein
MASNYTEKLPVGFSLVNYTQHNNCIRRCEY